MQRKERREKFASEFYTFIIFVPSSTTTTATTTTTTVPTATTTTPATNTPNSTSLAGSVSLPLSTKRLREEDYSERSKEVGIDEEVQEEDIALEEEENKAFLQGEIKHVILKQLVLRVYRVSDMSVAWRSCEYARKLSLFEHP